MANQRWTPDSWRTKPVEQAPVYKDLAALAEAERQLAGYPPLVFAGEARKLKRALGSAAAGEAFLLQGGDCAESFGEHSADNIRDFFRVFLQMAVVMTFAAASPIVKVGRVAGQFAKPRSSDFETIDGVSLPAYRGDIVNDIEFTPQAREPDPRRQLEAYRQSAATLNLLRAFATGGYANLENAHRWMLGFVKDSPQSERYQGVADRITETLGFMRAIGLDAEAHPELRATDFYTSHEALLLGYEQAMTRLEFDLGRLLRDLRPHGLDRRPHPPDRRRACRVLPRGEEPDRPQMRPHAQPRRASAPDRDSRSGKGGRPPHADLPFRRRQDRGRFAAAASRRKARGPDAALGLDPMHGNTIKTSTGYKTRPTERIAQEVRSFFAVCRAEGVHAGGVHLEMTGKNVTECTGGARAISEMDLRDRYHTYCDPRLNAEQSIEMAFLVADLLKAQRLAQPERPVRAAE